MSPLDESKPGPLEIISDPPILVAEDPGIKISLPPSAVLPEPTETSKIHVSDYIHYFNEENLRVYVTSFSPTCVYL